MTTSHHKIEFFKYQGTGNDFILIDDREEAFDINAHQLIQQLCDRKFGIGADGLILLRNHTEYDFEMVYFNADGYQTSMCGNGGRCIVKFAESLGLIKDQTTFLAIDGAHQAVIEDDLVKLRMNDVNQLERFNDSMALDTGSPHYVRYTASVANLDLINEAKKIRYNDQYKAEGINVNFIEATEDAIRVRTYERGVEDETLSCGTGVTAAAIVHNATKSPDTAQQTVNIETPGGKLAVSFEHVPHTDQYTNIWLIGPATMVFKGHI